MSCHLSQLSRQAADSDRLINIHRLAQYQDSRSNHTVKECFGSGKLQRTAYFWYFDIN